MKIITAFLLKSSRGLISRIQVDSGLGDRTKAIETARREATKQMYQWEKSDQFIGIPLHIEVEEQNWL